MQLINEVLHEHLFKSILIYLDGILMYTETMYEHMKLVKAVLEKLLAAQFYMKLSKCEFHKTKFNYLGYCISHKGVEMDQGKVQAVLEWEAPHTRKQLQSFLGFANFYRHFIPAFAQISLPIRNLLKTKEERKPRPGQPLKRSMECQEAFEKFKVFTAEPILKHFDPDDPFTIQADASNVAMGAILLQKDQQGHLQPCTYTPKQLFDAECK